MNPVFQNSLAGAPPIKARRSWRWREEWRQLIKFLYRPASGHLPLRGRVPTIVSVLLLIGLIGVADYTTGPDVSCSIFYLVPIALSAWVLGRFYGYGSTLLSAGTMLFIETQTGSSDFPVLLWNSLVRLTTLVIFAAFVGALRGTRTYLQTEVRRQTALLNEVAESTAREQARLARDLHDGIGQYLSGLALRTRVLADDLEADGSARAADARRLYEVVQKVSRESRRVDHFLGGVRANGEDLGGALRRLADKMHELFGLRCAVALPDEPLRLEPLPADMLFHIAQEALNNAVKHAHGSGVALNLDHEAGLLRLRVADCGPGLPPEARSSAGMGFRTMQQRAELIGAKLDVATGCDGRGVVVTCTFPLPLATRRR